MRRILNLLSYVQYRRSKHFERWLSTKVGTRFDIRRILVSVQDDRTIDCSYDLSNLRTGASGMLAIDLRNTDCTQALVRVPSLDTSYECTLRGKKFDVVEMPRGSDGSVTLEFRLNWPRTEDGARRYGMLLPEDIPWPLSDDAQGGRYGRTCGIDVTVLGGTDLAVGGVIPETSTAAVAVVIAPASETTLSPHNDVLLSPGMAASLDSLTQPRVLSLYQRIYEFATTYFGRVPYSALLIKHTDENVGPGIRRSAAAFDATREDFGIGTSADPNDFELAWKIAGAWWGGAIRVRGEHGYEVETAIRAHVALRWVNFAAGAASRDAAINVLERRVRMNRWSRLLDVAENLLNSSHVSKLVLSLERRAASDPTWPGPLRDLTASCWGTAVDDAMIEGWIGEQS